MGRNKRAFTLIELLVVILIIAILAAIALPQYQKAVDRSRFAQIWEAAHAINQAQEVYYLSHGEYASSLSDLDVDMSKYPGQILLKECNPDSTGSIPNSAYIYHPKQSGLFLIAAYQHQCTNSKSWANSNTCYAAKDDKRANEVCALMTKRQVRTLSSTGMCNTGVYCSYTF